MSWEKCFDSMPGRFSPVALKGTKRFLLKDELQCPDGECELAIHFILIDAIGYWEAWDRELFHDKVRILVRRLECDNSFHKTQEALFTKTKRFSLDDLSILSDDFHGRKETTFGLGELDYWMDLGNIEDLLKEPTEGK
jgi:hypothetical protein